MNVTVAAGNTASLGWSGGNGGLLPSYTYASLHTGAPSKEKSVSLSTTYVHTVGGYVGQITLAGDSVVWESDRVRKSYAKAHADAKNHLNNKIKELFQ